VIYVGTGRYECACVIADDLMRWPADNEVVWYMDAAHAVSTPGVAPWVPAERIAAYEAVVQAATEADEAMASVLGDPDGIGLPAIHRALLALAATREENR
jgi:hypothetical protein